jgi:CBS-domain-containing membrane protein
VLAVNVTDVPAQMELDGEALTVNVGTTVGVRVTEMVLLVANMGLAQVELLVKSQVTRSPFTSEEVVKMGELVPAAVPLTFQRYVGLLPPLMAVAVN